jgi:hypothetical protein
MSAPLGSLAHPSPSVCTVTEYVTFLSMDQGKTRNRNAISFLNKLEQT